MHKNKIIASLFLTLLFIACRRSDENLNVDLSKYNTDAYKTDPVIDKWLQDSLNTPYNIQVVYRFERNLTDVNRNISPVELNKVLPMMQAVRNLFLKPYEKLGGETFIKVYTPKQFVLYGSPSYNDNGSIILGSADGGRRVVLYELNSLNFSNGNDVKRKVRTIHHEFTHILNQNVAIPPSFEQVSKADYTVDWTGTANTEGVAKQLGFVSRYARSSFGEDFAEMTAHLLVEGPVWFNNYINTTNAAAKEKLLQKEKMVKDYFKTFYNIDFEDLQKEVQAVLKSNYGATDPADVTQTLPLLLSDNKVNTITVDTTAAHYTTYGSSAAFRTLYTNIRTQLRTNTSNYDVRYLQFLFTSSSTMTFRIAFAVPGSATVFFADYYFAFTVDINTGVVRFTKTQSGGAEANNNGLLSYTLAAFERFMLPYLTNRNFIADWLPTTLPNTSPLYRTFGGFYVQGTPTNYFYGPIVLK